MKSISRYIVFVCCFISVYSSKVFAQTFSWAQAKIGTGIYATGVTACTSDTNNNLISIGYFNGTVDFDPGPSVYALTAVGNLNMFILKQDAFGNFLWVKQIAGISSNVFGCFGKGVRVDGYGNIYTGGSYRDSFDFDPGPAIYKLSSLGGDHCFVLKLDATGNFIWAKTMGSNTTVGAMQMLSMTSDSLSNIYFSASIGGTATPVVLDVDPGPIVYNIVSPAAGSGSQDILIEKMDSAGNFIWAKQVSGLADKDPWSLAVDNFSNVFVTGQFQSTADFDPGPAIANLTSAGGYDIFIAKYDAAGSYVWAKRVGSANDDVGYGITVDRLGNAIVGGYFSGTVDFDPGSGTYNLTSNSTRSAFTLKLNSNGDFKWANKTGANVGLFTSGIVTTDSVGNVYNGLVLPNSCDINPSTGVFTVPSGVAVQKLDSSGNFVWGAGWQGDNPSWIHLDDNYSVYTTGTFSGSNKDFDPGPGTYYLSGSGQGSGFIHKMCQGTP
nr:hypothetical protein [Flavipsychrobacter sp.]